jgi:hypothetical protein
MQANDMYKLGNCHARPASSVIHKHHLVSCALCKDWLWKADEPAKRLLNRLWSSTDRGMPKR